MFTKDAAESVLLPMGALIAALLIFGIFVALSGKDAVEAWQLLFKGAFGDSFGWQNTLARAAPLMLTALCVAIPSHAGLTIIGAEGALVLGGFGAAVLPYMLDLPNNGVGTAALLASGTLFGAIWIASVGWLYQKRGVNETISSLLMVYIAIALFKHFVEGSLKDPASLNKPSTRPIAEGMRMGSIGQSDVHFGLVFGVLACIAVGVWLYRHQTGFSLRVVGGNNRAAKLMGINSAWVIVIACALGGAFAGLAGAIEVVAVHTSANASIIAGYGYAGILVSYVARHNPFVIIPVAILFGGFAAAGSLLQRRMGLPDASVLMLQGVAFVLVLASESLRGKVLKRD